MLERIRNVLVTGLGIVLCLFTLAEANYHVLQPQSALAVFGMLGLVLCYLIYPVHPRLKDHKVHRRVDLLLALATVVCCGYVIVQTEPLFQRLWPGGQSIGNRAGAETHADFAIGLAGVLLVLEATRRSIGAIVPLLSLAFVLHSFYCHLSSHYGLVGMPDWMLPHDGQHLKDIASTTFLQSLGVFGPAARVMFNYVFLFVVFGAFLEMSGATQFIIDFAERVFGRIRGGPAMVSVLGSALMGSLSGSAVANAVTTGTFTIPMMRTAGFQKHIAGGIMAAAAAGGALCPPVMGAGAYMMMELVQPQPENFLVIVRAAIVPACLYYYSILLIVYFYACRVHAKAIDSTQLKRRSLWQFEAIIFVGSLVVLILFMKLGFTVSRAVTGSLIFILVLTTLRRQLPLSLVARGLAIAAFVLATLAHQFFVADLVIENAAASKVLESWVESAIWGMFALLFVGLAHPGWRPAVVEALTKSAKNGISLVAASACVGIIIGIVQQTGVAGDFSSVIKGVVESNLLLALLGIMVCSIIMGMGVPSVVCYLLMATLMGSLLGELGVIPLAAHLFIFYFGMMSMVTPPVALAAYASASIAQAEIMPTALAAFRFALVGFTLPFMFVYRPALLLMAPEGETLTLHAFAIAVGTAVVGILSLAAGIAGYFRGPLSAVSRGLLLAAAALLLLPDLGGANIGMLVNLAGGLLFVVVAILNWSFAAPPDQSTIRDEAAKPSDQ